MTLKLTPEVLASCYDMVVAASKTLQSWNLPASEDIKFKVTKHKDRFGHHTVVKGVHHIAISSVYAGRFETLIATMAHEIVHAHQNMVGLPRADNKYFDTCADILCKELALDRTIF